MQSAKSRKSRGSSQASSGSRKSSSKTSKSVARTVTAPAAMGRVRGSRRPLEKMSSDGKFRTVSFEEYVQDIPGSVSFSTTSFPVQPGLSSLFAWLSTQAISYQEYRFRKLRFHFESNKGTGLSGKVMMAFLPDAADAPPNTKQEMLENQWKCQGNIWLPEFHFDVPADNALGAKRFIRSGALAAGLDIKTYDFGKLIVATQGCADTSLIGELYVEYEIELITPVINSAELSSAFSEKIVSGGTVSSSSLFGTAPVLTGGIDMTVSGNTITFNRVGWYLVTCRAVGTGLFTTFTPTTSSSTAVVNIANGGGGPTISNAAANAGTVSAFVYQVAVRERGQTAVFDCSAVSTTITSSFALVSLYNN